MGPPGLIHLPIPVLREDVNSTEVICNSNRVSDVVDDVTPFQQPLFLAGVLLDSRDADMLQMIRSDSSPAGLDEFPTVTGKQPCSLWTPEQGIRNCKVEC